MEKRHYETTEYTIDDTIIGEIVYHEDAIIQVNIFAECITSEQELENISELIKIIKTKVWKNKQNL